MGSGGPTVNFTPAMLGLLAARWGKLPLDGFACPVPGHSGRAVFVDDDRGCAALGCCSGRRRSLAEVRAAQGYGYDHGHRSNKELAAWARRLAWECGGFAPVEIAVPAPAPGAPAYVERVAEGLALLLGLRRADWPPEPVAYSIRFAAAWSGTSWHETRTALEALRASGAMVETGRRGRLRLWEPGEVCAAAIRPPRAPRLMACRAAFDAEELAA